MQILSAVRPSHDDISLCDPLAATDYLRSLPELNRQESPIEIISSLAQIIPDTAQVKSWEYASAAAAMRDIGMFLGSIKRFRIEPEDVLPQLTPILLTLGEITELPPRDTVLHYTIWNSPDAGLRTYTHFEEERILIESTRSAYIALEDASQDLQLLYEIPITDPHFGKLCAKINRSMGQLGKSICEVFRDVGAEFFVTKIRPYFEPILVNGQEHRGPGAVELPLFLIDHMLWSSNSNDAEYVSFKEDYLTTVLPEARKVYQELKGEASLLDRVIRELTGQPSMPNRGGAVDNSENINANVEELKLLFGRLISFRAPHFKLAQQAYMLTPDAQFDHGSGGYTPEIVGHVLTLTQHARDRLTIAQKQYSQR